MRFSVMDSTEHFQIWFFFLRIGPEISLSACRKMLLAYDTTGDDNYKQSHVCE
jgi:hypothetical protein